MEQNKSRFTIKDKILRALSDTNTHNLSNLDKQYDELYGLLKKCMITEPANGMALLVGPRGHGKRSLLQLCLRNLEEEYENLRYRIVKLNGLMTAGNDGAAMGEAAAQLTTAARNDDVLLPSSTAAGGANNADSEISTVQKGGTHLHQSDNDDDDSDVSGTDFDAAVGGEHIRSELWSPTAVVPNSGDKSSSKSSKRKRQRYNVESSSIDIGRRSLDNDVELREEHHTDRSTDMKDVQTFTKGRHQSSSHLNAILIHDALRRAKVDGIPVIFILNEIDSFADQKGHRQMLLYHLLDKIGADDTYFLVIGITSRQTVTQMFEKRVRSRFVGSTATVHFSRYNIEALTSILLQKLDQRIHTNENQKCVYYNQFSALLLHDEKVRQLFSRQLALGKDVRWFCQVLSTALILLDDDSKALPLNTSTIMESLLANGADVSHFFGSEKSEIKGLHADPRIQELLNLSGSQVAVLSSVKRLMSRSALASGDDVRVDENILTFDKIHREYETFSMRQSFGVDKYEKPVFYRAFVQLLECELLKLLRDHSGSRGSILEYNYNSYDIFNIASMQHLPVHLPYELELEIHSALYSRQLDCSTALRDWGLRSS